VPPNTEESQAPPPYEEAQPFRADDEGRLVPDAEEGQEFPVPTIVGEQQLDRRITNSQIEGAPPSDVVVVRETLLTSVRAPFARNVVFRVKIPYFTSIVSNIRTRRQLFVCCCRCCGQCHSIDWYIVLQDTNSMPTPSSIVSVDLSLNNSPKK